MAQKARFKKFTVSGPGGMKCPCCGGRFRKKLLLRLAKRSFNRTWS